MIAQVPHHPVSVAHPRTAFPASLKPLPSRPPIRFGEDYQDRPDVIQSPPVRRFLSLTVIPMLEKIYDWILVKCGFPKPVRMPLQMQTDAYTAFGEWVVSQASKDKSIYHITARRRPVWVKEPWMQDTLKALGQNEKDFRFIFYGLEGTLKDILGRGPITAESNQETDRVMQTARPGNKAFLWAKRTWDRIVNDNDGILPVKIDAPAEGTPFFPGEPVIKITAKDGYGDLANHLETKLLQVGRQIEMATAGMYWLEYNKQLVRNCLSRAELRKMTEEQITNFAAMQTVNFSDRSANSEQDSINLGMAFGLSHPVTSTMSSLYRAWKESGEQPAMWASMYSLAHRIVQSYPNESDAYRALFDIAKEGKGSYVSDCYDSRRALFEYLLPMAREMEAQNLPGTIYVRPDSGEPIEEIKQVLNAAVAEGDRAVAEGRPNTWYTEVNTPEYGKLKRMTRLMVIEADGVNFSTIKKLNDQLLEAGFSPPHCVAYGIGGALVKLPSRDSISFAEKVGLVGEGENAQPTAKIPMPDPKAGDKDPRGKWSIPIPPEDIKLVRDGGPSVRSKNEPGEDTYVTFYDGTRQGRPPYFRQTGYRNIQQLANREFTRAATPEAIMSPVLENLQDELVQKYHGRPKAVSGLSEKEKAHDQ
jgi:nicotinic acid phosphoribosyltransferase